MKKKYSENKRHTHALLCSVVQLGEVLKEMTPLSRATEVVNGEFHDQKSEKRKKKSVDVLLKNNTFSVSIYNNYQRKEICRLI